jgi:hypothetical protein
LEAADVFLNVEGLAEAAGAVQDLGEGFEVDWWAVLAGLVGPSGLRCSIKRACCVAGMMI